MNDQYRKYLKSGDWKQKRRKKLNRNGGTKRRCAICASEKDLDVHHLSYRRDLTKVRQCDLRLLCRTCHNTTHELINAGVIRFTSTSHHHRFAVTKAAVLKKRGISGWSGNEPDWVQMQATLNGGWTREQLAVWGVPWPPPKGWKTQLVMKMKASAARLQADVEALDEGYRRGLCI